MPKIKVVINKTNQAKIDKFIKSVTLDNKDEFVAQFQERVIYEIRSLRDCSEKNIITEFIDSLKYVISNLEEPVWKIDYFDLAVARMRTKLAHKYTADQHFDNNIDIYFNEVKREYILHPMNESDSLEFLPENRDIFIKNNLKLVINCAKRYRGLGLPFEDLIQVGNYGLLIAFDKFDTSRDNLRKEIMNAVEDDERETFTHDEAAELVASKFIYGKLLDKTLKALPDDGFDGKQSFKDWVMLNVRTAVFASVAFQWTKASILYELSHFGSTVNIPKSAKLDGIPPIVSLDSFNPHTDDNYHDNQIAGVANEEFIAESESLEREENDALYKNTVDRLLGELPDLDRRVVKKKFGIGFPMALSINEIAESEGMTPGRVKVMVNQAIKVLADNVTDAERNVLLDLFTN